jgi:23S rRNA (cytosine1962-C5)-methyltransferase
MTINQSSETVKLEILNPNFAPVYPVITLHKGKEISLLRRHPWLFSGAIKTKPEGLKNGDVVEIHSDRKFLATGFYADGSIAVRIISFTETAIDKDFWRNKIQKAWQYRQQMGILDAGTNCCRLFYGEGDGVPGLVLDYYNGHVVFQAHTPGVFLQREHIYESLKDILGPALLSIYDKSAETLGKNAIEGISNGFAYGGEQEVIVKENSCVFRIDFVTGQKTGFFLDQRNNRSLLAKYCEGKNVLNAFSYTGGFSVFAAKGGAALVHSVDVSEKAIALCDENARLNQISNHEGYAEDVFDFMKDKKQFYDVIVLDPPAFAKSRDNRHQAVIGYKRLNTMAMKNIKENGILFTFSCSGVVDKYLFYNTISSAAMECGREVRILGYLSQPEDHPVIPYFPEGEYLKGMILWVGGSSR